MSWSWLDCKCIQLMQTLVCGQRNINIFSEQTADFLFFLPLFVIGHLATFSPAVVQNLSLRSGCCDVPRATAANVRSMYNLPVSLYPIHPFVAGGVRLDGRTHLSVTLEVIEANVLHAGDSALARRTGDIERPSECRWRESCWRWSIHVPN